MYKPKDLCLNDFDVSYNRDDGIYELTHLQGPDIPNDSYDATTMENSYGHAVSHDLINWEAHPDTFKVSGKGGTFDDSAIWTMKTLYPEDPAKPRMMFYTGLCKEHYFRQQIGLALFNKNECKWERYADIPILSASSVWYQTEGLMAWRDPYVVWDEQQGHYIMFISAKDKRYDPAKNGCIATAFSHDLINWEIQPPLISPCRYNEMECPVLFSQGGHYYILVSTSDTMRVHIWQCDSLLGEYEETGFLTDHGHYAARVIPYNGQNMVLHTQWTEKPSTKNADINVLSRGFLCNPRKLIQDKDGTLTLSEPVIPATDNLYEPQ